MKNWKENVRRVVPYVPGEQPKDTNIIKLNTNENPYPPSPFVLKAINSLGNESNRRYPDPTSDKLVKALADFHGVGSDRVFVGVGSDDVLGMIFMTFFNSEKDVLFADVTYSFYPVWCEMLRINYREIPLDDDFKIRKEDYMVENGGIVIANPNAPTGIIMNKNDLIDIIEANSDSIVVVDEAYIDFAREGQSCLDLLDKYDNLIVVRTFSKSRSLAGLRIGYAISSAEIIKLINDVKYSYNSYTMNSLQIEGGSASVSDNDYFRSMIKKVVETRERTTKELEALGFEVLPSSTNFIFAKHNKISGTEIFEYLKDNKIYVRHFNQERIMDYLRITIGTDEEMDSLIRSIKVLLDKKADI
ncbi:MAG: histidinol-phosphate transaminase [Eubacterium sp.]|nr:histidinol-phosphate transaminase [Eubacterium sp.]